MATIVKTQDVYYVAEVLSPTILKYQNKNRFGRIIKIGKTTSHCAASRNRQLNEANNATFRLLQDPMSLAHPLNVMLKLTDKRVRDQLVCMFPECTAFDSEEVIPLGVDSQGFTECIEFPITYSDVRICKMVSIAVASIPDTKYIKNTDTKKNVEEDVKQASYVVEPGLTCSSKTILSVLASVQEGQSILLMRAFSEFYIAQLLSKGAEVTIVLDNYNVSLRLPSNHSNLHIRYIDFSEEEWLKFMKQQDKFNYIIGNPPYRWANKIMVEAMKHCDKAIILMPISKYNGQDLYKHVSTCETVDANWFKDAAISANTLCVTTVDPDKENGTLSWSEFKARFKSNDVYKDFYVLNQRLPKTVDSRSPVRLPIDIHTTFMISPRIGDAGISKTENCHNYKFNVLENLPEEEWPTSISQGTHVYSFTPYRLNSRNAKKNLCRFWYDNPLMNLLIQNSGESSSSYNLAMPRIDWSIDRDYEHMTYEELLEIVKHDLRELGLSDEVN